MKVAEVILTSSHGLGAGFTHIASFADLAIATSEFDRVADLMTKREQRNNDLPKMVELQGINRVSVKLDDICSVGLVDYAKANEEERGMKEAFPNLGWAR